MTWTTHNMRSLTFGRVGVLRDVAWIVAILGSLLLATSTYAEPTSQPAQADAAIESTDSTATGLDAGPIDDLDLLDLEIETVVTGLRRARAIEDTPYAVSVITAQDIRDAGARSVPEALRLIPGVDVGVMYSNVAYIGMRGYFGSQAEQNVILIDGRRLQAPVLGRGDFSIVEMEDVDRIEVIRGPASGSWGSGATNGMINIVTKDPADQQGLTAVGKMGSRRWQKEYVSLATVDGNTRSRVSGSYEASNGLVTGQGALYRLHNDYDNTIGTFKSVYEKSATDILTLSGGSNVRNEGYDNNPLFGFPLDNSGGCQSNFLTANWHKQTDLEHTTDTTFAFTDLLENSGYANAESRYQQFTLDVCNTLKPANHTDHTIVWGLDTKGDIVNTGLSDPQMTSKHRLGNGTFGLYAEDDWDFAERWTLSTGARIDYDCYGGFEPSGRLALSYKPDDVSSIYGAISRAFMMPAPGVHFLDMSGYGGLLRLQADHGISNTTMIAYELGYRRKLFNNKVDTNAAVYWNEYADAFGIGNMQLGPPGLIKVPVKSLADCSTYGFEFGSKWYVTPKLTLLGNYTYQQMNWRGSPSFALAMYLPELPEHKFTVGQTYALTKNLRLSSFLYYVTETTCPNPNMLPATVPIDEYFKLDVRAEYSFWKDRATLAVGVQNALDPRYYQAIGTYITRSEVPRVFYAELRVTFK